MGQAQSGESHHVTTEFIHHELALKFSKRCFNSLELYSFRDVFHSLADHEGSISYLKEDTVTRFLEIPEILGASSVLYQMMAYLGAFPFGQDAPVVLGFEQMIMVVVMMTERYQRVLKRGNNDRAQLLFRSMAVYENPLPKKSFGEEEYDDAAYESRSHAAGFAIDVGIEDEGEDEDDGLALAALESLDVNDVFKHAGTKSDQQSSIPTDNLRKLIMLLLLTAPLEIQESFSKHADRLHGEKLSGLRQAADNVLAAFIDVEKSTGVKLHRFKNVVATSLPYLFTGLTPLFEDFLFSKNVDFTKKKAPLPSAQPSIPAPAEIDIPVLSEEGEILDINVLCQLSFFIPKASLFRCLRLLYSGGNAGYSMGSFETHVFNWRAPTILLVSGTRISDPPESAPEKSFCDTLPPKRFPDSGKSKSNRVVFGVYLHAPWRQTYKDCIGDDTTMLFQLEPVHEVFHASVVNPDYVAFTKPPTAHSGISVGSPHPKPKPTAGLATHVSLGPVSLMLDSSFEFGVFTHNYTSGGGAFHSSTTRRYDWQDRFEIESLEVWGSGGDEEAKEQVKRWEWEQREAENRRRINIGRGDIEADRALLEMAGIINSNRGGGSMG